MSSKIVNLLALEFQNRLLVFVSPVILLIIWGWACHTGVFPEQILVSPKQVLDTAKDLWSSGELQMHLKHSLYRLALGFWIGTFLGLVFGIVLGISKSADELFSPILNALRQVPTIAFIPMLILIFGVEETFKIVIVAKASFYPVSLATYDAIKGVPRSYFEVAKVFKIPTRRLITHILLPATVPPVLTGFRISLTRSWVVLVAAELMAADSGIGQMMEMGRQMFRIDIVMVGVFVTGFVGFILDQGIRALENHLVRWKYR